MLTIRKSQLDAFEQDAMRAFEDRTYAHLQAYFPEHCTILGDERMRRVIRHGFTKSTSYDLTAECCVRSYIEFMCLLGGHFDTDPLLPWAAEILRDRTTEQIARGDRLYSAAWEHINHLIPDYRDAEGKPITARFVALLRQLRHEPDDAVSAEALALFSSTLLARLEGAFPAKCGYIGRRPILELIAAAVPAAAGYGIKGERGLTLFATLMFVLGSEFHQDLLLPWASATLTDPAIPDERRRVNRLYAQAVGFLNAWWGSAHPH